MKVTKKLIALLLSAVMLLTAVPFAFATEEEGSIESYKREMLEAGIPIISTEDFGKLLNIINTFI